MYTHSHTYPLSLYTYIRVQTYIVTQIHSISLHAYVQIPFRILLRQPLRALTLFLCLSTISVFARTLLPSHTRSIPLSLCRLCLYPHIVSLETLCLYPHTLSLETLCLYPHTLSLETVRVMCLSDGRVSRVESVRVESMRVESVRVKCMRVESVRVQSVRVESMRVQSMRVESLV